MINESFAAGCTLMVATSLAVAALLIVRGFLRRGFGARIAYASWLAIPLAALATLLPAPVRPAAVVLRMPRSIIGIGHIDAVMSVPVDWRPLIVMVWLVGVVGAIIVFVVQQRRYLRSLGCLHSVDTGVVRASSADVGPVLVGAWRPLIVLPADFETRFAPVERDLVLAHERLHRERGDALVNAMVAALRCLNWFNPLIHYAAGKFRFDQELACDAAVITRFPEARRSYADAMLKAQLAGQSRQELRLPVGCRWPSGHPLKERILMLKKSQPTRIRRVLGVALVALLGFGGGYVAWAAQASPSATIAATSEMNVVDADLVVSFENETPVHSRMINPVGAPFAVMVDGDNPWRAEMRSRQAADGNIELAMRFMRGTSIIAEPVIVVRPGEPGTIEVGKPGESGHLRVRATLALHEADWRPEASGDAIGKSADESDASAQEDVSYRRNFPPDYPKEAIAAHQSGHLVMKVLVDEQGEPKSAEVANAQPPEAAAIFGPTAITTVMQWRFNPARKAGQPVSGYILVPIDYSLSG